MLVFRFLFSSALTFFGVSVGAKLLIAPGELVSTLYAPAHAGVIRSDPQMLSLFVLLGTLYGSVAILAYALRDAICHDPEHAPPITFSLFLFLLSQLGWASQGYRSGQLAEPDMNHLVIGGFVALLAASALALTIYPPSRKPIDDDADDEARRLRARTAAAALTARAKTE